MRTKTIALGLAIASAIAVAPVASRAAEPVDLTVASFKVGSSWYVYAATLGEILRSALPEGSSIDTPPLGGGAANVRLVAGGKAQLALSHAMTNRWAYDGSVAFDTPMKNLRALAGGLDTYYLAVAASGAEPNENMREYFAETNPKAVIGLNPPGSVATFAGELILVEAGASKADLEKSGGRYAYIPIPDTIAGFADGSVSVTPQMITVGHPMITEISETSDATLLQPGEDTLAAMTDKYGFSEAALPANSFKGQTEDLTLPSTTTTLIVRDDLSDDLAYAITKAVVENKERLEAGHKALADFKPEDAWKPANVNLPLHPGAERYYRERGWLK